MMALWHDIGFIRWPMAFAILWIAGLSAYSVGQLFRPGAVATLRNKAWLDGILFWGAFTAITGVLGSLVGIIIAFQSVEAAGAVSPTLVAGGAKVALISSALGLLTLVTASIGWYFMQMRWRLLVARGAE